MRPGCCVALAGAEGDAPFGKVVWRELNGDAVAGEDADVMFAHLARDVRGHDVTVVELNAEQGIGQGLDDRPLHLDVFFFRHARVSTFGFQEFQLRSTRPGSAGRV